MGDEKRRDKYAELYRHTEITAVVSICSLVVWILWLGILG
jgi:hypothetical protein